MPVTPPVPLLDQLRRAGQEHLVRWWADLSETERSALVPQIEAIDFSEIARLAAGKVSAKPGGTPAERAARATAPSNLVRLADAADRAAAVQRGRELLNAGRVGVILVAGGQGTRLGHSLPKGMLEVGPVSRHTLFQILMEQAVARGREAGRPLPYYIMTSEATHAPTLHYLEAHAYFGLGRDNVKLFQQGTMPAVDAATGQVLLSAKGRVSTSPDGHGGMLSALRKAGLVDDMRRRGVDVLYYHQVDNPTAIVCDPEFLGFHALRKSEMSTKVVAKRSPDERMGVVVDVDGRTEIIEYSDLPAELSAKQDAAGQPIFWAGSTAIHAFDRAFLERLIQSEAGLPFHIAKKKVPHIDERGAAVEPQTENGLKFERFIFDALPQAESALVYEADRAREFNPVKNATGNDSPETAKAALTAIHRGWLEAAGARVAPGVTVEIGPLFAVDAAAVAEKIGRGREFTSPTYLSGGDGTR